MRTPLLVLLMACAVFACRSEDPSVSARECFDYFSQAFRHANVRGKDDSGAAPTLRSTYQFSIRDEDSREGLERLRRLAPASTITLSTSARPFTKYTYRTEQPMTDGEARRQLLQMCEISSRGPRLVSYQLSGPGGAMEYRLNDPDRR